MIQRHPQYEHLWQTTNSERTSLKIYDDRRKLRLEGVNTNKRSGVPCSFRRLTVHECYSGIFENANQLDDSPKIHTQGQSILRTAKASHRHHIVWLCRCCRIDTVPVPSRGQSVLDHTGPIQVPENGQNSEFFFGDVDAK
ncbi:hypothetical protein ARMSODRAFT_518425 [Armillaria solidipes]|uniref:Uncharacterized protein n=1 Tax=Armillaria solidipes TaxID=1076256 RepID=A0A2H3AZH9_9AGAR|nr:hypothetical protein ARMSODRAFT_518425 [Armillaria solidipes]